MSLDAPVFVLLSFGFSLFLKASSGFALVYVMSSDFSCLVCVFFISHHVLLFLTFSYELVVGRMIFHFLFRIIQ